MIPLRPSLWEDVPGPPLRLHHCLCSISPWWSIIPPMAPSVRAFYHVCFEWNADNPRLLDSHIILLLQLRCTNQLPNYPQALADGTMLFVCSWTLSLFTLEMIMTSSCVHSCSVLHPHGTRLRRCGRMDRWPRILLQYLPRKRWRFSFLWDLITGRRWTEK